LQTIKSSRTPSFAAALAIHTLDNTSPGSMHTSNLYYTTRPGLTAAVFISHGNINSKLNTCSVKLPAGAGAYML